MSGDNTPLGAGDRPHKVERSITLPYAPVSVMEARHRLCVDLCAMEIEEERVDDALLILSELVSNALRHAGPLPTPANPENTVGVSWRAEVERGPQPGSWIEISVRDGGSSTMPRVARPSASGLGGRGLSIVQSLSGRWGTEMDADTTTVWAVLEISAEDVARGAMDADTVRSPGLSAGPHPLQDCADVVELRPHIGERERVWGALL